MTREQEGPTYEVLRSRTVVWLAVLMVAIGIGVAAWLVLAYGRGDPRNSLEAIKTAGTIVIGSGGAVALWLAVRRQRTAELAIAQKDRELRQKDRDQAHTARDAVERRVTELYTMAAAGPASLSAAGVRTSAAAGPARPYCRVGACRDRPANCRTPSRSRASPLWPVRQATRREPSWSAELAGSNLLMVRWSVCVGRSRIRSMAGVAPSRTSMFCASILIPACNRA